MSLYENAQWAVTEIGLESIKPAPSYLIEAERLAETTDRGNGNVYDWPIHMAEKSWVDLNAFVDSYRQALKLHAKRYAPLVDWKLVEVSIDFAHKDRGAR